jgi:hypothetical protein
MTQDVVASLNAYLTEEGPTLSVPVWLLRQALDEVSVLREQVMAQQKLRANLMMQNLVEAFELEPWLLEYFLAEPEFKERLFRLGDLINICRTENKPNPE